MNGLVDTICHDNHSSLSLRAPLASCELWGPCCHHLPWQPLDAVLKPEPALDIARLDVPAPVTAQFEQTEVLCDWFNADTVFHILIQKKSNIILISENYPIVSVLFSIYMYERELKGQCQWVHVQDPFYEVKLESKLFNNQILFSALYLLAIWKKKRFKILELFSSLFLIGGQWKWYGTCLLANMSSEASLSSFSWTSLASSLQDSARRSLLLLSTTKITAVTDKITGYRKITFWAK